MKDRTIIAAIAIPSLSALIYTGHNGAVTILLATIVGWYFGRETEKTEKKAA